MPKVHSAVIPKNIFAAIRHDRPHIQVSQTLIESAAMEAVDVYERFATRPEGLTTKEAQTRLAEHGANVLAKDERAGIGKLFRHAVLNPLVILLAVLASVSFATGDFRAGTMMLLMIALGVGLKLIQEAKADSAAAKLKAMISVTANVIRDGESQEINVSQLVRGDVVELAAGNMDQRHSKPRRDGCAMHRQDRHADDGPCHPGTALQRDAERRRRSLRSAQPNGTRSRDVVAAVCPERPSAAISPTRRDVTRATDLQDTLGSG